MAKRSVPLLTTIPLTVIPLVIYNLFGFNWNLNPDQDPWVWPIWNLRLPSTATWSLTAGDALIVLGIAFLFVEIMKATRTTNAALVDHLLSVAVLIIYVVQFVAVPYAAHSVFFILAILSLIDVIAGFSITITGARRDVEYQ